MTTRPTLPVTHATTDRKRAGTFTRCPECGSDALDTVRVWWRVPLGALMVLSGLALAIPTLGASLVVMIWGVFIFRPRPRCTACGWRY